jgi:hypothetical protein
MTAPKIETPRGTIVQTANGQAELTFNPNFVDKWQGQYTEAQKFVDTEVLRLSEPYVPLLTSMLIKSGILGTNVGSGTVQWIAPYARRQYYSKRIPGSLTGPLRGPFWFERMKAVSGEEIIRLARELAGGGG